MNEVVNGGQTSSVDSLGNTDRGSAHSIRPCGASAVLEALALGEPGYDLWRLVLIPDYPAHLFGGCVYSLLSSRFGDKHFWAYTFNVWLFLIGGAALCLKFVANATNTMGLDLVVLGIWMAASVGAFVVYRRVLPLAARTSLILLCWPIALLAYRLIGYYLMGWVGLGKDWN